MWSYIAGGLKIKVINKRTLPFGTKSSALKLIINGGLKIEGCKVEGLVYMYCDKIPTCYLAAMPCTYML